MKLMLKKLFLPSLIFVSLSLTLFLAAKFSPILAQQANTYLYLNGGVGIAGNALNNAELSLGGLNSFDSAQGQGLLNITAGAAISTSGTNQYLYTSTRGASRLELHDGAAWIQIGGTSGTQGQPVTWTTMGEFNKATPDVWLSPRGVNSDFYINPSGNIGIGTISPLSKLTVLGQAAVGSGGNTQSYGYDLYVNGQNGTAFIDSLANPGTASLYLQGRDSNGAHSVTLQTSSNGVFSIFGGSGSVGIETTTPASTLDVNGSTTLRYWNHFVGYNEDTWIPYSDGNEYFRIPSGGFATFDALPGYNSILNIHNNGYVGIGTSPGAPLDVQGANTGIGQSNANGLVGRFLDGLGRTAIAIKGGEDGTAIPNDAALNVGGGSGLSYSIHANHSIEINGNVDASSYTQNGQPLSTTPNRQFTQYCSYNTTTSTSLVDTGLAMTYNSNGSSVPVTVMANLAGTYNNPGAYYGLFALFVDGSQVQMYRQDTAGEVDDIVLNWQGTLSSGSHDIRVKFVNGVGSNYTTYINYMSAFNTWYPPTPNNCSTITVF